MENRFSAKNCIVSQLEGIVNDLEHMTSGNFMHNRASARLLAKCAIKEVDKVIEEERERCVGIVEQFYYFHELQHALRLCGLNELADNFKIE